MMHTIDFYYWGDQCPHNSRMKKLLETLNEPEKYVINSFDISKDFNTALRMNINSLRY